MAYENSPPSELYNVSRKQIQSYDAGLGPRLLWLINGQAFGFGIYCGLTFAMPPTPYLLQKATMFGGIIPVIGAVVTLFTLIDIFTTIVQLRKLRVNFSAANNGAEKETNLPLIDATATDRFFQRFAAVGTTVFFMLVWVFFIMYDHQIIKLS